MGTDTFIFEAGDKISVREGKGVFHMIPGDVLEKNTRNLYTFFPSFVNSKYVHTVAYGIPLRTKLYQW